MKHDKYPLRQGAWDDPWDRPPRRQTADHTRSTSRITQNEWGGAGSPPTYSYSGAHTATGTGSGRPKKKHRWVLAVLAMMLVVGLGSVGAGLLDATTGDWEEVDDQVEVTAEVLPDVSGEPVTEESTQEEDTAVCYLEQAELTDQVQIETVSRAELSQLSYEEIYAANIDAVVSLRCYLADGTGCTGTGIVISKDGYLVTNAHVIENATECVVVLQDDGTYQAKLVGLDEETDLAVLKIEARGLTPAVFGDSEEMVVGNACVAIGNPLGETFRGTMTTGIISALNRNVSVNGHYMTLIQTDCAINSGNSGGPLINLYGQVVGICNMKMMSTTTTVEGLGFAIPSNTVKTIVNKLLRYGEVTRAMLGITAYNMDQSECRSYGISGGIVVVQVNSNSDAFAKGIRSGDVITAANGTPISTVDQLNTLKADMAPGDQLTLTVLRDGEYSDIVVLLMEESDVN